MTSIFILLAVSGLSGFVIGKSSFSWPALIVAGAVLATLGAVVFQGQGFTALSGIFTIVGCLVVNQIAYVLGRGFTAARDDRNDGVRHKDSKNRQKSPTPSGQQRGGACRQAVLWPSSLMERAFHDGLPINDLAGRAKLIFGNVRRPPRQQYHWRWIVSVGYLTQGL